MGMHIRYASSVFQLPPQGPRAQIDRTLYKQHMKEELQAYHDNLHIRTSEVFDLVIDHEATEHSTFGSIKGVRLSEYQSPRPANGLIVPF